jgi:hypothetical protein
MSYYCRKLAVSALVKSKQFYVGFMRKNYYKKKDCYNRENYFFHTKVFELKV